MPRFRILGPGYFAIAAALLTVLVFPCGSVRGQDQPNGKTSAGAQNQAPLQLKVASNLIIVRVVVRDAHGKPVEGLQKEDFKLFDRGKEQTITQFDVETPLAQSAHPSFAVTATSPPAAVVPVSAMPQRFVALYFDDLNTSDADMIQARDAADHYLAANLEPQERVGIFTSGETLADFTGDPKQIHDALSKLHTSPLALARIHNCPELSDYQALEITEHDNPDSSDAWKMAIDEKEHRCDIIRPRSQSAGSGSSDNPSGLTGAMPSSGPPQAKVDPERETTITFIGMLARSVVDRAAMQSRANLQELDQLVKYISQMPGQRNVILVSPGFLSQSEQYQLDGIIDRALRSQVVISSLDPKGLAVLMREADATIDYMPTANSGAIGAMHSVDWARELVASDVLAEVAYGTGGEFFHNNNDLKGGFRALAGSPVYYILAFAPSDIKQDGKFHSLKVTLTETHTGLTLQARRGYFAPMTEAEAAEAEKRNSSDAEAQSSEQIREAILSRVEIRQFSVEPFAKLSSTAGDARELSLRVHLDGKSLRLRKDADANRNMVTFTCAIFDQKENLLMSQQVRTKVNLRDAQLQEFLSSGVNVDMTFKLKPGAYRVREVVTDSEEHHMTAFSRSMKIP